MDDSPESRKGRGLRRYVQLVVGFGLSAALLWIFFRNTDWGAVQRAIVDADVVLLLVAMVCNALTQLIRSARWRILLQPLKPDIALGPTWRYFNIGFAVSSLLPGRVGEILRPYLLARNQKIGFAPAFATVVVERVIELTAVLVLLSIGLVFPDALGSRTSDPAVAETVSIIRSFGFIALGVAVGTMLFLLLIKYQTERAVAIVGLLTKPLPRAIRDKLLHLVGTFADGVGGLNSARQIGGLLATTVVTWLLLGLSISLGLSAFGIDVPYHHSLFLLSVVALGVAVPTPAGSGTYHGAVVVIVGSLWAFNETMRPTVAAFAIVSHLVAYIPVVGFGVYYLLREGIRVFAAVDEAGKAATE